MRPNILWIVTTQWRAQALGYAGDVNARTPALDALARQSAVFTDAVTPHPFGPFARAALLTGVASPGNGVRDYHDPLPAEARTVAHALRERSYATAFFGKWHLAPRDPAVPLVGEDHARTVVPAERRGGFEFWEGFEGGFQLNNPWLHGSRLAEPTRFDGYQSDILCERAGTMLRGLGGPWFAVLSLEAPHPPYGAPAAGIPAADPATIRLRPNVPVAVAPRARADLAGYYAHIAATDRAIGALVASLPEATIIVFTSVHGDMHGAHGLFRKGWPHDESVRVPLLVRHGGIAWNDRRAVSLSELPALAAAWADGAAPAAPAGPAGYARISMPSVVALPEQCDRVWSGLRSPTRKVVLNADGTPWLFFDLDEDPFELRNLVTVPSRRAELAALREAVTTPP